MQHVSIVDPNNCRYVQSVVHHRHLRKLCTLFYQLMLGS